jgi:hypothetical protein
MKYISIAFITFIALAGTGTLLAHWGGCVVKGR